MQARIDARQRCAHGVDWCRLALALIVWAPATARAAPDENRPIGEWVRDLDADRYQQRAAATDRLIAMGGAVAGPVAEALPQASTEMIGRGVHVLKQLALTADDASRQAAYQQLSQLSQAKDARVARRAGAALESVERVRMQEVLEQLVRLGLEVQHDGQFRGLMFVAPGMSLTIGSSWKGTPEQLQLIRWLRDVESVRLVGPQVTDAALSAVSQMKRVKTVFIWEAAITDGGLAGLRDLKSLQQLTICYSPLTDGARETLQGLSGLHALCLCGTQMTRASAVALQEANAQVTVDFRHGAFLGLGCKNAPAGCTVDNIRSRSAAENGGLRVGDVIVRYNQQPVATFEDLVNLIAENRVGETVPIEVSRGAKNETLSVQLGAWDEESLQNALPRAPRLRLGR